MAPWLKLLDNFHVRTFWSSRNSYSMRKFGVVIDATSGAVEVTHILEMQLEDYLSPNVQQNCPSTETVISLEPVNRKGKKKFVGVTTGGSSAQCKRQKIDVAITTRRWQEVWAYKYTWTKGEFNVNGDLIGVVCKCCTTISGQKKVMVPKGDNLEKHEGKRVCKEDGVPFSYLKKGGTFTKKDCKHLQFCKLLADGNNLELWQTK